MDGHQTLKPRFHLVGQIVIGAPAICIERVAANRWCYFRMEDRACGWCFLEAPIRMPTGAKICRLFIWLAAQLQHVGTAFHGLDERVFTELA